MLRLALVITSVTITSSTPFFKSLIVILTEPYTTSTLKLQFVLTAE
jgi:hypothetical protein